MDVRAPISDYINQLSRYIVDAAYTVHSELGPGLLEAVYETCLAFELRKREVPFERQVFLPVQYGNVQLDAGFRIDLWVDRGVIVELKSVEAILPVHKAQLLTYLKLTGNRIGLLINFNVARFRKAITRLVL